ITFYAVNDDGSQKWSYTIQPQYAVTYYGSCPAVAFDNSVYFLAAGWLYSFTSSGALRSAPRQLDDGYAASSPAIGADGTVYVVSGSLLAFTPAGALRWSAPLGSQGGESVAIGTAGTIYVTGGGLHALRP